MPRLWGIQRPTCGARIWMGGESSESWERAGGHPALEISKEGLKVPRKCKSVKFYYTRNWNWKVLCMRKSWNKSMSMSMSLSIWLSKPTWRPQISGAGVSPEGQCPERLLLNSYISKNASEVLKTTYNISFLLSLWKHTWRPQILGAAVSFKSLVI